MALVFLTEEDIGKSKTGNGQPTTETIGAIGSFYTDVDTGLVYKCIDVKEGSYVWQSFGKSAYETAQSGGYLGTEEEFAEKLATDFIDWFGVGIGIPSGSDLNTYTTNGKYYASSESVGKSLLNRPEGMNTNFVMWVFSRTTTSVKSQLMLTLGGKMYIRSANSSAWRNWVAYTNSDEIETLMAEIRDELINDLESYSVVTKAKTGLTVGIIGDSISTFYGENAFEMEIVEEDVGVELKSYITYYDVGKIISLDGVTSDYMIATKDVGSELTFIPCADDVGKKLGEPKNYNTSSKTEKTWWQVAADKLGFEPIAAAWSGSSITSHTADENGKECSYAWHRHTIRKLGKRIAGSMDRIAPDVVLIYRGTNDLSHSKKVRLTNGYFDKANWRYPTSDVLGSDTYGYKEGLALTIKRIRETYPRTRIVLCTCNVFKRTNYLNFPTNNGYFSIPQMNDAIREAADFFGCHVIELDKCGITFENCYSEGYITDSSVTPTHPNTSGHALMGQQAICDLVHKLHIEDIEPAFAVSIYNPDEDNSGEVIPPGKTKIGDVYGTLVDAFYINKNTGKLVESEQYFSYTEIEVVEGATYKMPYARNTAFYDSSNTRISGAGVALDGAANAVVIVPEGAVSMSTCYKYIDFASPTDVVITIE